MIINQRKMKREHQDDSSSGGINQRKMKRDHQDSSSSSGGSGGGGGGYGGVTGGVKSECSSMPSGKAKMCWAEEDQESVGGGMDELLAVLGYKVRASDMAEVAQKLEQLEMVLGSAQEDGSISHLSDTVHFNPSDLSGWVESMLCELNPNSIDDNINLLSNPQNDTGANFNDNSEYDLRAIPGVAAFPPEELQRYPQQEQRQQQQQHNAPKRLKTASMSPPASAAETELIPGESARPVVLVDSQDAGVRLVHTLMACAEAVQQNDLKLADALVKHVGILAASQPGAMRKVATHFAEALARRIYAIYPNDSLLDTSYADMLQMHFYETCPYLKFAHFTANQAILEAFASASRVHVIDFGLKQGMQWPALMQALALRPGGPPAFRLTGIGPPQSDGSDALQQVGWKLAQLAETIGVEFEFRGFVANSLADLEPAMLDLRPPEVETVAVNSVFELHRLLARPGAVEKVLKSVRAMRPRIFTVVEQEASHNGPVFRERFTEALHYYSTMFDSLEISPPSEGLVMSEVYLGKQICNVVACEGSDRVERHEKLDRWRERLGSAGFDPVHLGSNAFKQASMLLAIFAGREGYMVEENGGCLMLDWHTRPLIATSAWQLAESR